MAPIPSTSDVRPNLRPKVAVRRPKADASFTQRPKANLNLAFHASPDEHFLIEILTIAALLCSYAESYPVVMHHTESMHCNRPRV